MGVRHKTLPRRGRAVPPRVDPDHGGQGAAARTSCELAPTRERSALTIVEALGARWSSARTCRATRWPAVVGQIMDGEATPAQIGALLDRAAHEGRDGRRDGRRGARRCAARDAARVPDAAARASTPAAPAATARARSTSRRWPRSWSPACGVTVAKHGNRALSSQSRLAPTCSRRSASHRRRRPPMVDALHGEAGIGFLFAPAFHAATATSAGPRTRARHPHDLQPARAADQPGRACATRSSASTTRERCEPLARALGALGLAAGAGRPRRRRPRRDRAGGRRPTSPSCATARCARYELTPSDFGLDEPIRRGCAAATPSENARVALRVLAGGRPGGGAQRRRCMTAGAALLRRPARRPICKRRRPARRARGARRRRGARPCSRRCRLAAASAPMARPTS